MSAQSRPEDRSEDPRDVALAELLETVRTLQADYTVLARRVLAAEDQPAALSQVEFEKKAAPLEPVESERARILAAWDAEEKVLISIAPDANDTKIRDDARARLRDPNLDFLPRTFQVNGVQLAVPVGRLTRVPMSIAQLYEYMTNPWAARQITPPITFDQAELRIGVAA